MCMHLILREDGRRVTRTYELVLIAFGDATVNVLDVIQLVKTLNQ
jgi:hypothetical protein